MCERVQKENHVAIEQSTTTDVRKIVHSDPEIVSGTPVFVGTRVPVRTLIDHLAAGDPLDVFLDDFPSVSREQAVAALEYAGEALLAAARANARLPR